MLKTMDDVNLLWDRYIKSKNEEDREALILYYVPLVKKIVYKLVPSYSKYVDVDDLMGCGIMGLIHAVDRFEPKKGVPFESFAYLRIKGEIIDYLRKQDFVSTSLRKRIKSVENAMESLEIQLGRTPTDEELSNHLNIDQDTLHKILDDAYTYNVMYLEDALDSCLALPSENSSEMPEESYDQVELKEILAESIDSLSEREKLVVSLYYFEDLSIKEIAQVLGVSESRVSQLHSKALMKLRGKLSWRN